MEEGSRESKQLTRSTPRAQNNIQHTPLVSTYTQSAPWANCATQLLLVNCFSLLDSVIVGDILCKKMLIKYGVIWYSYLVAQPQISAIEHSCVTVSF